MRFSIGIRGTMALRDRPMHQQIQETCDLVAKISTLKHVTNVNVAQHWIAHPTIWLEPFPILGRLAAVSGNLDLVTSIIQLPLYNPVHLAEMVATLDHITNGHLVLGVGNGYREVELEAANATRRERAPRVEEAIQLMKLLWAGENVDFGGRFYTVHGQLGLTPVQKPHPPIWIAAHAIASARRGARIADGILLAPQIYWEDLRILASAYEDESTKVGRRGSLGLNRSVHVARDRETALKEASEGGQSHVDMYSSWDMQEAGMVNIHITGPNEIAQWAIVGSPADCAERISGEIQDLNLDYMALNLLNFPKDQSERFEYLDFLDQEVLGLVK